MTHLSSASFFNRSRLLLLLLAAVLLGLLTLAQTRAAAQPDPAHTAVWVDYDLHERNRILVILNEDTAVSTTPRDQTSIPADLDALPDGVWTAVFDASPAALQDLKTEGEAATGAALPDLSRYFYVTLPDGLEAAEALAQYRAHPYVAGAYPVDLPTPPPLPPDYESSNDGNYDDQFGLNVYQRYLDAAPDGMDVRYAWEGSGGDGDGIAICDVEYGFHSHSDQPPITLIKVPDNGYPWDYYAHGTAVLGMLGAKDNGWGITGMVPQADFYFSPVKPLGQSFNIANAILNCLSKVDDGDVILVEQQASGRNGNFVPAEWDPSVYAAIKTAVASGVVVVEAAGNGNEDLDNTFYITAKPGHTPFAAAFDSGAIIVGAATSAWTSNPNEHNGSSSYGSTVDLRGWGMHLIAPGYGDYYKDDGDLLSYTLFSGTSGASPMVTAAAAIVQGNYITKNGSPRTPAQVRTLLRNTGTDQENVDGKNIGPMPDLRAAINQIWNFPNPTPPAITPAGGIYNMPLELTIDYGDGSQSSSNTHLRYTLDGSEPTEDSYIIVPEFGDTLHLLYGATVRAKAFSSNTAAGRYFESATTTMVYGSSTPKVATPQISPNAGSFSQGTQIVISTSTPGATIRYRTDGRAPSFFYPGTEYTGPITLDAGTYTIVARGYRDGYYKSDAVYSEEITISPVTLPAPTIYPGSGSYPGEVTVYMGSNVLGAEIRYTLNGSTPTSSSPLFVEPFTLDSNTTVKARIYLDGYSPSSVVTQNYTVLGQASTPTFSPPSGSTANDNMQVTLATSTPGATIRYTTNGAEPTSYSTEYTGPFNLGVGQHTVKARAYLPGANPSSTATATYTVYNTAITLATPTIDPPGGNFNGPITVSFAIDTEEIDFLYYTLDGTDPSSSGSVQTYNGPFTLNGNDTYYVRVRAYKSGVGNSPMASATLVVVNPTNGTVQTPTIDPPGGVFTNSVSVRVEAPDFSTPFNIRRLYVTQDGTEPVADFSTSGSGSGGVYNFTVTSPRTVQALAAQTGWVDSNVAAAEFTFVCDTPAITEGGTYLDSKTVSISSGTTSAKIYYTTDGSEPTTSDPQYSGPFAVTETSVVKAMCTRNNYEQSETAASVFVIEEPATPPSISSQPQSTSAATCTNASFMVDVTGTAPFSYSWTKDGTPIAGADEPTLDLAALLPADAGSYQVTVTNSAGKVTSQTAVLTVTGSDTACEAEYQLFLPLVIK